eukprot:scaffold39792_cov36-Cyclotella_meneghiniana.AAC.1
MPKRGIDTPAKDDPNRKKPRQETPQDGDVADAVATSVSKSAPIPVKSAPVSKSAPSPAPTSKGKLKAAAIAVSAANKMNNAPAATSRRGLLDIFRGAPAEADKKEKESETVKPIPVDKKSPKKTQVENEIGEDSGINVVSNVKGESLNKRGLWGLGVVAALGMLNIASVSYLVSEQAHHNTAQMQCRVENEKLSEDLSRNQGIISVLKSGLDAAENQIKSIEQAQEKKKQALLERREKNRGGGILTEEENNKWAERKRFLTDKRGQLLDDFNIWLAKLDNVDSME